MTLFEQQLDRERRNVGVYAMVYVRPFSRSHGSVGAARPDHGQGREPKPISGVRSMRRVFQAWRRARALRAFTIGLDARAQAATLTMEHVNELPEAMQKCMHWVINEIHVTAQHAAAGLGHHEAHAHQMLNDLVARGFLHRASKEGQVAFRARVVPEEQRGARPHLWQLLTRKTNTPPDRTEQ